jgi:endonuclease/exonuclease/phosphatase family metal-dependent hydrolase
MSLRRLLTTALTAAALTLAACDGDDEGFTYQDDGRLQVMSRNLYLGAALEPVFAVTPGSPEFIAAALGVLGTVTGPNDFNARVGALADEIAAFRPDLVGIQEGTLWRTQVPGDNLPGGAAAPAQLIIYDFLSTLQAELVARGVPYNVVVERDFFDVEVLVSGIPGQPSRDVRLTDRQAILAIAGLPTSDPRSAIFPDATLAPSPVPDPQGAPTTIKRGWTAVNATVGGREIAFYNTHLEAFSPLAAAAQAAALRGLVLDPDFAGTPTTVAQVLVGDLNADPNDAIPDPNAYEVVAGAGDFIDLVEAEAVTSVTATCCLGSATGILTDPGTTEFVNNRIDHILWRGTLTPVSADIVGEAAADFAKTGRWPSDHAGVVGTFRP